MKYIWFCSFQILFRESIRMVCFRISCFKFLRENMNLGELSNWCFESSLWLADFKKCDYRGGPIMSANLIMIGTKYECKLHNRRDQIRVQTWSQYGPNMSANLILKGTKYECKLSHKRDQIWVLLTLFWNGPNMSANIFNRD